MGRPPLSNISVRGGKPTKAYNYCFVDCDDPTTFMLLSGLNGVAQGLGFPAALQIIRQWWVTNVDQRSLVLYV